MEWFRRHRVAALHRADVAFDARHGLETEGYIPRESLSGISEDGQDYGPSPLKLFRRVVRKSGVRPSRFTFVDLGCGKGRPLFLASELRFKAIVGIEADPRLAACVRRNVAAWTRGRPDGPPIDIIEADVRAATYPAGDLFLYLYNPFRGRLIEEVAQRIAALAREPDRAVVVAYNSALHADAFAATGVFTRDDMRPVRFWLDPTVSFFRNAAALSAGR